MGTGHLPRVTKRRLPTADRCSRPLPFDVASTVVRLRRRSCGRQPLQPTTGTKEGNAGGRRILPPPRLRGCPNAVHADVVPETERSDVDNQHEDVQSADAVIVCRAPELRPSQQKDARLSEPVRLMLHSVLLPCSLPPTSPVTPYRYRARRMAHTTTKHESHPSITPQAMSIDQCVPVFWWQDVSKSPQVLVVTVTDMLRDAIIADLAAKHRRIDVEEVVALYLFAKRDVARCDAILGSLERRLAGAPHETLRSAVGSLCRFPNITPSVVFDVHRDAVAPECAIAQLAAMAKPKAGDKPQTQTPTRQTVKELVAERRIDSGTCEYVYEMLVDAHGVEAEMDEVEASCREVSKEVSPSSVHFVARCVDNVLSTREPHLTPKNESRRATFRRSSSAEPRKCIAETEERRPSHISLRHGSLVYGSLIDVYMPVFSAREMLQCLDGVELLHAASATEYPAEAIEVMEQLVNERLWRKTHRADSPIDSGPLYPVAIPRGAWAQNGASTLGGRWKAAALKREFPAVDPLVVEFALAENQEQLGSARDLLVQLFPTHAPDNSSVSGSGMPRLPNEDLSSIAAQLHAECPDVSRPEIQATMTLELQGHSSIGSSALLRACRQRLLGFPRQGTQDRCGGDADFERLLRCGGAKHAVRFEATPMPQQSSREAAARVRTEYLGLIKARNELFRCASLAKSNGKFTEHSRLQREGEEMHEAAVSSKWRGARRIVERNERTHGRGPELLDLHGLFVDEALYFLEVRLESRETSVRESSWWLQDTGNEAPLLHVVTGVGKHSHATRGPRLRRAVIGYLYTHGWQWRDGQPGVILVSLCRS